MNLYEKLYMCIYKVLIRMGNYDVVFKTAMLFSFLLMLNIFTILFYFLSLNDLGWSTQYWSVGLAGAPVAIFNFYYFVKRSVVNSFVKLTPANNKYYYFGLFYILLTFTILLFVIS